MILFFFFFAFFPLFAIFSVNDEPSWIENGLLQLLLGNNGEGKKENNEGRKRKPQVMIKQFIKYFSAPPNKKHTIFSLFFQVNTKINFSPSLQPPKYKILNTNTKYKSYLPLWQPTDPLLAVFPSPAPDHQTHIKQVTDKIRQMQIKIWQMQIKIWQMQIKIQQMQIKIRQMQIKIRQMQIKIWQMQIRKYTDKQSYKCKWITF